MKAKVRIAELACSTETIEELLSQLRRWLPPTPGDRAHTILCVNAHISNLAAGDAALAARLNAGDILAFDGMAMVWAARLLGYHAPARCNMTEAFRAFLEEQLPPRRALLIGMEQDVVDDAALAINAASSHCRVEHVVSGFKDLSDYEALVRGQDWDFILVGCGTPRSEEIVMAAAEWSARAVVWHIGAGTIQFFSGRMKEAPRWMRRAGLQWLHRLLLEPRKMWRRYLLGNITFVRRVLRSR